MSDTLVPPVEHDDWNDEGSLPLEMLVLTSPDLDHDERAARRAADQISTIIRGLLDQLVLLEDVDRAFGESTPVSTRARSAQAEIRRAIAGFNEVIAGTSGTRDALVFYWKSNARPPVVEVA